MANTRQSAKRARQSDKKYEQNKITRTNTRTAVRKAIRAITAKDLELGKPLYKNAVMALDKAAAKGALPKARASRKISRLFKLAQTNLPELVAQALPLKKKDVATAVKSKEAAKY